MLQKRSTEIDEAVAYIHRHLHDPLPLARLARYVAYSPFHFTRMFKEQVGLPPLYFVSALRLQKAKELLLTTSLSVRDIGLEIGQQSLGTFTTRFSERVGVTPSDFRRSALHTGEKLQSLLKLEAWQERRHSNACGTIAGTVRTEAPFDGFILIGLFAKPIPEGIPLSGTLLPGTGKFALTVAQPGTYYVMATAVSWNAKQHDILLPYTTLRTRNHQPVLVRPHDTIVPHDVALHEPRPDDPPILISLPLLMNRFLLRMGKNSNS